MSRNGNCARARAAIADYPGLSTLDLARETGIPATTIAYVKSHKLKDCPPRQDRPSAAATPIDIAGRTMAEADGSRPMRKLTRAERILIACRRFPAMPAGQLGKLLGVPKQAVTACRRENGLPAPGRERDRRKSKDARRRSGAPAIPIASAPIASAPMPPPQRQDGDDPLVIPTLRAARAMPLPGQTLEHGGCAWILGDVERYRLGTPGWRYCNVAKGIPGPYCDEHHARAHAPKDLTCQTSSPCRISSSSDFSPSRRSPPF